LPNCTLSLLRVFCFVWLASRSPPIINIHTQQQPRHLVNPSVDGLALRLQYGLKLRLAATR